MGRSKMSVVVEEVELAKTVLQTGGHMPSLDGITVLKIGEDDFRIQRESTENRYSLEDDQKDPYRQPIAFVYCREKVAKRLSIEGKMVTTSEIEPDGIVFAKDMLEAIQAFEEENGRRTWLPFGDRQDCQFGSERSGYNNQFSRALIYRIRKENIIGKPAFFNDVPKKKPMPRMPNISKTKPKKGQLLKAI